MFCYRYSSKPSFGRPWECVLTVPFVAFASLKIRLPIWSCEQLTRVTLNNILLLKPKNVKRFNVVYKYSLLCENFGKHVYFDKADLDIK